MNDLKGIPQSVLFSEIQKKFKALDDYIEGGYGVEGYCSETAYLCEELGEALDRYKNS